jgi:hypothetical protein
MATHCRDEPLHRVSDRGSLIEHLQWAVKSLRFYARHEAV